MAVPRLTTTFLGQDNLQRALNEMQEVYGPRNTRRVYNTVLRDLLSPAVEEVRSAAPVNTGQTGRFIGMRIRTPRRGELRGPNISPNTVILGEVGYLYRRGEATRHPFLAIEYGTSKGGGEAPIRNTFRRLRNQLEMNFIRLLENSVDRTQRRLERRLNRQGTAFVRR